MDARRVGRGASGSRRAWALAAALAVVLGGCPAANDDDSTPTDDDDDDASATPLEPTWDNVFDLLSFRCGCHDAEQREGGMYDLTDAATAWSVIVDVPSEALPSMDRIEPGDPEASYLLLKVQDRHRSVGGDGARMPPTGFALTPTRIALIRDWIEDGAPD